MWKHISGVQFFVVRYEEMSTGCVVNGRGQSIVDCILTKQISHFRLKRFYRLLKSQYPHTNPHNIPRKGKNLKFKSKLTEIDKKV